MANLPKLTYHEPITDAYGRPTVSFHIWWDMFEGYLQKNIEDTINAALSAHWSKITDDDGNKPENNATLGADLATNVTNNNMDNLLDGLTYGRVWKSRIDGGRPLMDFAEAIHLNKTVDYVADGNTYGRPLLSRLSAGKPIIDFAETIHSNKNIDNIADGTTYGRPWKSRLDGGRPLVDFAESIHLNKTLDYVADTASYVRYQPTERTKLTGIAEKAGANVTLVGVSGSPTITGNKVLGSGVDGAALTTQRYRGPITIGGVTVGNSGSIGITDNPSATTYADADVLFSAYVPAGAFRVFENGVQTQTFAPAPVAGQHIEIQVDDLKARFFVDGEEVGTPVNITLGTTWLGMAATGASGGLEQINFAPASNNNWVAIGGTGKPADNATVGADWSNNLTNRPSNLAALAGTEGIDNALVPVSGVNLIPNPNLIEDSAGWTFDTGVTRETSTTVGDPKAFFRATGNTLKKAYAYNNTAFPATAGRLLFSFIHRASKAGTSATVTLFIKAYDAAGALLSEGGVGDVSSTSWQTTTGSISLPTNTATALIEVRLNGADLSGGTSADTVDLAYPRVYYAESPAVVGAGARYRFTGAISYTVDAAGTTATVSVGAGNLLAGGAISYNAMSKNISGSSGSSVDYFLYANKNVFTEGDHTLEATTSNTIPYTSPNVGYIGKVTINFTASGSGTGTTGGGNNLVYPD